METDAVFASLFRAHSEDELNFFNFNLKKAVLLLILVTLPLVSINMEQKQTESSWFSKPFSWLGSLVQSSFYNFSTGITQTTSTYLDLINLKKESAELKKKNQEALTQLQVLQELKIENDRLKSLLDFKSTHKMELVAAEVIGRDLVPDHNTITIDKGTANGIKAGQAVITMDGVLGYIFRPEKSSSHVLLITDRYAVVDGLIQRTRVAGLVEGRGSKSCVLKYLESSEDVRPGDLIVTGGLDNIFPKGFPLAIVESAEKKNLSVSLRVDLRPAVNAARVESVFVVLNAANEDLSTQVSMKESN